MKFVSSSKYLIVSFPTADDMMKARTSVRANDELIEFNSHVKYIEQLTAHSPPRDFSDLSTETSDAVTDYLAMQIGLDWGGDDVLPLTWVSVIIFLRNYGAPYPRRLLASFEYFHSIWDVERFVGLPSESHREARYPNYVSDYIRQLTQDGLRLIADASPDDAY